MRMNVEVHEEEEEEERPWEEVIKRKRRPWEIISTLRNTGKSRIASVIIWKSNTPCFRYSYLFNESLFTSIKKPKMKEKRHWDGLPSTALVNIFCKSELRDRLQSIPFVCKSWKSVTDDPRCWSSLLPDSVSLEDAFIKKNSMGYDVFDSYQLRIIEEFIDDQQVTVGVSRLQTLLRKSGGGAAITTLYISAFVSSFPDEEESKKIRRAIRVIRLIANSCPNLKHISFNRDYHSDYHSYPTYEEALLQLFKRCKKLELVDLSYFGNGADPSFIQEMGSCLPNLRGIRIQGYEPILASIAEYLPQLKLLCLHDSSYLLNAEHLSMTLFSHLELQYLYVDRYQKRDSDYDKGLNYCSYGGICMWPCYLCYAYEDFCLYETVNFCFNDYCDILKRRKEDQYASILTEKKEYHLILKKKKEDHECNSSLKKKKKKKKKDQYDSTLKKKKKDQCNYADFVIQ